MRGKLQFDEYIMDRLGWDLQAVCNLSPVERSFVLAILDRVEEGANKRKGESHVSRRAVGPHGASPGA